MLTINPKTQPALLRLTFVNKEYKELHKKKKKYRKMYIYKEGGWRVSGGGGEKIKGD